MSSEKHDRFTQTLIPKSNPNDNRDNPQYNGRNIPPQNRRQPTYYQKNPNYVRIPINPQNSHPQNNRTLKNHPKNTPNRGYKGKVLNFMRKHKKSIATGLLAATLLSGTAIGVNVYEAKRAEKLSRNIEQEISFDGQCDRPELYKVLHNTDLDEILNEYYADPTDENKQKLMNDLQGREEELAKFNVDLLLASLADSANVSINDVQIKALYKFYNEINYNEIINGKKPYRGNTLTINNSKSICEGYVDLPGHVDNYLEIPEKLYKLITDAKFNLLTPDSSYFAMNKYPVDENENSKLERSICINKDIKYLIIDNNLAIKDGKVCVVDLEDRNNTTEQQIEDDELDR